PHPHRGETQQHDRVRAEHAEPGPRRQRRRRVGAHRRHGQPGRGPSSRSSSKGTGMPGGYDKFGKAVHERTGFRLVEQSPVEHVQAVTVVAQAHHDTMTLPEDVQAIYNALPSKTRICTGLKAPTAGSMAITISAGIRRSRSAGSADTSGN